MGGGLPFHLVFLLYPNGYLERLYLGIYVVDLRLPGQWIVVPLNN